MQIMVNLISSSKCHHYHTRENSEEQARKGRVIQCDSSMRNDPRKLILKKNKIEFVPLTFSRF